MATNLDLDPHLVEEAMRVGGRATKKEAVTETLREYIARPRQAHVTTLFGGVRYRTDYDTRNSAGADEGTSQSADLHDRRGLRPLRPAAPNRAARRMSRSVGILTGPPESESPR